ncbi:unnamed protein product [Staurois parvus]|uniref:Uncharacterized protein n=1 Tax=Staurois parvus TaxID=386267 RepID=A0ABN9BHG0_9NEOB|nr:unnamed protein product [Staurois parvus]
MKISLLLNIPRSTVSGIITKCKQLGIAATQPRSEWGQRMLTCSVHRSRQLQSQ